MNQAQIGGKGSERRKAKPVSRSNVMCVCCGLGRALCTN